MHTDLLADWVRRRREELGLSQEDIADRGGPSTTTLTKIESGTFRSLRHRTMLDLDKALGWRGDSTERLLYLGVEPVVVPAPRSGGLPLPSTPVIDPPRAPRESDAREWFVTEGAVDSNGSHAVIGSLAATDAEGVRSVVEVRYWPGDASRVVSMAAFPSAVAEAYRAALEATNIHREPKETHDEPRDPAPKSRAEVSSAPDDEDVSDPGYMLAARDDDDDDEVEAQQVDP